jgi:uncharacterized protein (TIGR00297 family)
MLAWALLLRYLTAREAFALAIAAFVFNWQVLPRLGLNVEKRTADGMSAHHARAGILIYPITVALLIALFGRHMYIAGAAWAILALGDPAAASLGESAAMRWPFNRQKSPAGTLAYFAAAAVGALTLLLYLHAPSSRAHLAVVAGAGALAAALVEALPVRMDDNFSAPLAGALVMSVALASHAEHLNASALQHRWLWAVAVSGVMAAITWAGRLISTSGACTGFVIAAVIYIGLDWPGFAALLTFFALGTIATRVGYAQKARLGVAEARSGRRRWTQVLANGLVPAGAAALALFSAQPERAALAAVAALAEAASDTVSSELGQTLSRKAYMIGTFTPVRVGTDGGVSIAGTAAGMFASFVLAVIVASTRLITPHGIWVVVFAATVGNLIDSVLGATLERRLLLDNDSVNFVGTLSAALLTLAFMAG